MSLLCSRIFHISLLLIANFLGTSESLLKLVKKNAYSWAPSTPNHLSIYVSWGPGISISLCFPGDSEAGGTDLENCSMQDKVPKYTFLIGIFFSYFSLSVFVATIISGFSLYLHVPTYPMYFPKMAWHNFVIKYIFIPNNPQTIHLIICLRIGWDEC